MFNATFNNISAITWRPVLVVEEAEYPERMGKQLVSFINCGCESSAPQKKVEILKISNKLLNICNIFLQIIFVL